MALSALGVGALASGPAFAQNGQEQVPAPRLYSDITACAGGVLPTSPTKDPRGPTDSPLDTILDGDRTIAAADIDATEEAMLNGLLDLAACTNPVATGVDQAVDIFNEYNAAKAALPEADADPDPDATARYNRAKAALDAFRGSVYNEVYNQRMQLESVGDAVDDYNELVGDGGELDLLKDGYDAIVVNDLGTGTNNRGEDDDDPSWNTIYGTDGIRGYQAIDIATHTTGFDGSGVLQLEETASTTTANLGQIVALLDTQNTAVKDADEALKDAIAEGNADLAPLRETLRRATKARDHIQGELTRLTSIVRAQNRNLSANITIGSGADERTLAETEREVLAEYGKIQGQVDAAEAKVRSTVGALENANGAVMNALASPNDYLDQLVTLRTFQKAAADAAVADAGSTPAPSLVTAAEEAAERLAEATDQRDAHMALISDPDSPASALLNALLEPEMRDGEVNLADDDGRAVIDAIADTYGETQMNAAAIAAIGVTGDDVASNTAAIATNTADIATNTADIADHETRISGNEAMLMDHEGRITSNTNMLMDHEGRISTNEATLVDHGMKLMQKKEYIDNLGAHIGVDPVTGMGTGEGGMSRIDMNAMGVGANREMIMTNMEGIEHNHMDIMQNRAMIDSNSMSIMRNMEDIQTLKSGVAASMALGGMPEMGARGVSVGAGSYGGETALAVGVHFSGENSRFKIGVTSSGGETGASLGAGWSF